MIICTFIHHGGRSWWGCVFGRFASKHPCYVLRDSRLALFEIIVMFFQPLLFCRSSRKYFMSNSTREKWRTRRSLNTHGAWCAADTPQISERFDSSFLEFLLIPRHIYDIQTKVKSAVNLAIYQKLKSSIILNMNLMNKHMRFIFYIRTNEINLFVLNKMLQKSV